MSGVHLKVAKMVVGVVLLTSISNIVGISSSSASQAFPGYSRSWYVGGALRSPRWRVTGLKHRQRRPAPSTLS